MTKKKQVFTCSRYGSLLENTYEGRLAHFPLIANHTRPQLFERWIALSTGYSNLGFRNTYSLDSDLSGG